MSGSDDVIESLAAKLAAADLDDAEVALLRTLIGEPDEVVGFAAGWADILSAGAVRSGFEFDRHSGVLVGDQVIVEVRGGHKPHRPVR